MNSLGVTRTNPSHVSLLGLDFGSTTSSALVARAHIARHPVSGKVELAEPQILYRSAPVFTPFSDNAIDANRLLSYLVQWIDESGVKVQDLFSGGAIVTGLAARRNNAAVITELIRSRIGHTLIATADDPRLESWLAFMGSCATLSRFHGKRTFVNLDIGGGTTNPAWGRDGQVLDTACYFIGARHFEVAPGTYRLTRISTFGARLLQHLGLAVGVGDTLSAVDVDNILNYYVLALEAIVTDDRDYFDTEVGRVHEQARRLDTPMPDPVILFSGGVGELIYSIRSGVSQWSTTHFGDLGIDLAQRIIASAVLSRDIDHFVPEQLGRATVYGLALHSTEISGRTVFLSNPNLLPLHNVPIVARLTRHASAAEIEHAMMLADTHPRCACIQITADVQENAAPADAAHIKQLSMRIGEQWLAQCRGNGKPLLLITSGNIGKSIGNYATQWSALPINLIVIDEIPDRHAHFVNVGQPHDEVIPVSFYGIH